VLSSLKMEDKDRRIIVSSLKFSTRSSMRPNCLLIRLVRGVRIRGRELLGLFDTNRLAYQKFSQNKKYIIETDGVGILCAHAARPIVILVYTISRTRPRSNDATDDLRFCEHRFVMDACVRLRVAAGVSKPWATLVTGPKIIKITNVSKNDCQTI
jgi:hypothetical protein